jgi:hypothetical protein
LGSAAALERTLAAVFLTWIAPDLRSPLAWLAAFMVELLRRWRALAAFHEVWG